MINVDPPLLVIYISSQIKVETIENNTWPARVTTDFMAKYI